MMQEEIGDQRVLQKLKSPAAITPIPRQSILRFHGSRHTLSKPKVDSMAVGAVASRSQAILRHSFSSRDSSHDLYPELHPGDLDGNVIEADECYGCRKIRDLSSIGRDTVSGPESIVSSSNGDLTMATTPSRQSPSLPYESLEDCPNATPEPLHELKHDSSVLALAVSDDYIFAGTHNGEIVVWSLRSFQHVQTIQAHKRTVLCLFLSTSGDTPLLFSSAGDAIISVWCPKTFKRLYEIYSTYDVGDMFSVAYSAQNESVYMGAQNASIQWVNLKDTKRRAVHESERHPDRRHHRFFDSKAVGGTSTPRRNDERWSMIPRAQTVLEVQTGAIRQFAHFGYVYSMLVARGPTVLVDPDEEVLISGGGDGTIKLWRLSTEGHEDEDGETTDGDIQEIMVLGEDDAESVISLAIDGSFLYAGKLHGVIELWDLDTKQRLRVIKAHSGDIMTLQMSWGLLWSAAAGGSACKHSTVHYGRDSNGVSENVSQKYQCLSRWKAHEGKILASAVTTYHGEHLYITGANDDKVCIWRGNGAPASDQTDVEESEDMIITTLREFVSYKTVSSRPEFAEDCRKGANFLASLFKRLGGQVEMLSSDKPHNPVVYAKFAGKLEPPEKRKRILFYGHYDVVPADTQEGKWSTDPFKLTGTNGYLYGRGVSDNKGPITAALYAVTDLMQAKALDSDVIFLIEGEEESGSPGFQETVRKHKQLIGDVDYILLANSYWLDDEVPCLTYGLRGVLHATVCVDSKNPDLHSGVDGSYMMSEPLSDLTHLMSKLKGPRNRVMIPSFYDGILPVTAEEESRYDDITQMLIQRKPAAGPADVLKRSLMARWREPNLTIHRYRVSGPDGSLVSSHASANISLRLVPGQEVDQVIDSLVAFLRDEFEQSESSNSLTVRVDNKAEPWLGVPGSYIFRTLEDAVMRVWSMGDDDADKEQSQSDDNIDKTHKQRRPLYIREGGSIPAIRFLEKEFGAPAAHLPCGQASDSAHLENERLRVTNLLKSREIFGLVFRKL